MNFQNTVGADDKCPSILGSRLCNRAFGIGFSTGEGGHVECSEGYFISKVPGAKTANNKTKNRTVFTKGFEVGFQVVIFEFLAGTSIFERLSTIFKGTTNVDDCNFVRVINNNIGTYLQPTVTDGLVSCYCTRMDSGCQAINNFIATGGNSYHVGLMSNTSDRSPMDKSLLLVVPIHPMVKIFTVGEMSVKWGNIILLCTDWGSYL